MAFQISQYWLLKRLFSNVYYCLLMLMYNLRLIDHKCVGLFVRSLFYSVYKFVYILYICEFPLWLSCKESACNVWDLGLIPGLGRSAGEGNRYPLQYSGLENSIDCIVHGVTESDMTEWLSLSLMYMYVCIHSFSHSLWISFSFKRNNIWLAEDLNYWQISIFQFFLWLGLWCHV